MHVLVSLFIFSYLIKNFALSLLVHQREKIQKKLRKHALFIIILKIFRDSDYIYSSFCDELITLFTAVFIQFRHLNQILNMLCTHACGYAKNGEFGLIFNFQYFYINTIIRSFFYDGCNHVFMYEDIVYDDQKLSNVLKVIFTLCYVR